jgi:Raf kinase inhibitor-like YbhB/YbcL family protein
MRLVRGALGVALLAGPVVAMAQATSAAPPPRPQQGRRVIAAMTVTSSSVADGAKLPTKHTQLGDEMSPALSWSGAPDSAVSFVVVMHDLSAPVGNGTDDLLHWMVWNIPASTPSLPEGVPTGSQRADGSRQISATGPEYRGPAIPATGPAHHYAIEVYALDVMLDVPAVGASPPATRAAVMTAMGGHVRGKGVMVVRGPGGD